MSKARLYELELVRAFAILAVLLIHGTADGTLDPPEGPPPGSRSRVVYIAVNELSNFAVPVFFMISGLVLFYRYFDTWKTGDALSFYRKRLQYILIPYAIWSLFYHWFYRWLDQPGAVLFHPHEFIGELIRGDAGYHLYFIVIIVQFYAIFPILMALAKKFDAFARNLAVFGIATHIAVFAIDIGVAAIPNLSRLCLKYFSMFCIGGYIGIRYDAFMNWLKRHIWWVAMLATALGFTLTLTFELAPYGVSFGRTVYLLLLFSYSALIGWTLIYAGKTLLENAPRLSAALLSFGSASFGIYFIHPGLLSYWKTLVHAEAGSLAYDLATWGGIALIVFAPWAIVALLKRFRWSWVLFGK